MEKLKNEIIKNGGFTVDYQLKPINKNNGYMVSNYGTEKAVKLENINNIDAIIKEYQKLIKNKKNYFIGAWLNDNIIYIDISKHYTDKKQAKKRGIINKQLAIYDLKNGCNIDLLKNVYIIYKLNKINNDITFIKEYNTIREIEKDYNIKNGLQYICKNIDNLTSPLLKDNYIIINDKISYNEI